MKTWETREDMDPKKEYVAEPIVYKGEAGWGVRNTTVEGDNVVAFYRNKNAMFDWHVFRARFKAWWLNYYRRGENT